MLASSALERDHLPNENPPQCPAAAPAPGASENPRMGTPLLLSPAEFGKVADETEKWGKEVQAANIKAE
jgi:hypothetical protein